MVYTGTENRDEYQCQECGYQGTGPMFGWQLGNCPVCDTPVDEYVNREG